MTINQLEKLMSVNPFGTMIEVDKMPEMINRVEPGTDKIIERFIERYSLFSNECNLEEKMNHLIEKTIITFTPLQIDFLLQMILPKQDQYCIDKEATGRFITKLVKQSYNAGNNDFNLTINDAPVPGLCDVLNGTANQNLTLNIHGNIRFEGGALSNHCTYTLNGDIDTFFGKDSKNCIFKTTNCKTYDKMIHVYHGEYGVNNKIQLIDDKGNIIYGK